MNYDRHLYILRAIEGLREAKSWTGKTHVQKTLFLTQAIGFNELPFKFVLYRHGPYSFEVDQELEEMVSYGAIDVVPQGQYGPTLLPGEGRGFPEALGKAEPKGLDSISKVASFVGSRNVVALESLATATWVVREENVHGEEAVLKRLKELKPHLEDEIAKKGVQDSDELQRVLSA
ncbi:MAG TPA: hypothetical protein PLX06_00040 [Fimbriimonadaceae bacterium]|nr:hypothetical protein [Fimbriimonadaceae bacterium]